MQSLNTEEGTVDVLAQHTVVHQPRSRQEKAWISWHLEPVDEKIQRSFC